MATATSIQQFKEHLNSETGIEWKETLHPGQVNFNSKAYGYDTVYFCEDEQCKHGVFFVPEQPVKTNNVRAQALKFIKKNTEQFLPAVKVDLNKFPEVILPNYPFYNKILVIRLKPNGNIILKNKNSMSPMTYSTGKLTNFSLSAKITIKNFFDADQWQLSSILPLDDGSIKVVLKHVDVELELNAHLFAEDGAYIANLTTNTSKLYYKNWEILGELGFKITGNLYDNPSTVPTSNIASEASAIIGPLILIGMLRITAGAALFGGTRFALADLLAAAFV